ncbi:IS1182 family transposase [Salinisphaera sp. RV14]|uniref:IS1182 family transposase n=1 Tax=unclassified Salinisphaera TaxID=2649847 RepID=UPI003F84F799
MADRFRPINRETPHLFPPSVQDYVADDHLARFVVDIVDQLDLSPLTMAYGGRGGSAAWHPAMLLSLLFYGYATGTFSSRKLEAATYDSVAVRYICANQHPDHDSISAFRQRFLAELETLFVQILLIAHEMGTLKLGTVSVDGTKIKANASKHKALSWGHANALEAQLRAEVAELMRLAEAADNTPPPDTLDIPAEIQRRQDRLAAIAAAKQTIQARADERDAQAQAEYEAKLERRARRAEQTGRKPGGKPPAPPTLGPRDKDQVNLTDDESRIMPTSGGGFEQSYNAQASVDHDSGLIVSGHVTDQSNDQQQLGPALSQLSEQAEAIGTPIALCADAGYYSQTNVQSVVDHEIVPFISDARERHNPPLMARLTEPVAPPADFDGAVEEMRYRMRTADGRAVYAQRKCTIEPTFGIIKHVLGFRQFLLRGLNAVTGEWNLVCIAFNLKKLHTLSA